MERRLIIDGPDGQQVIVEFDYRRGGAKITGAGLGKDIGVDWPSARVTMKDAAGDDAVWVGQNFSVPATLHEFFKGEYPGTDLMLQYHMADRWCSEKKRQWKPKSVPQFMGNWLKRASNRVPQRGGGVVL